MVGASGVPGRRCERFDLAGALAPRVTAVSSAGFDTEGLSSAVWPGGETEALTRLERHLERKVSERTRADVLPGSLPLLPRDL